ncbi:putative leucine-rich repeat domain superfamily [Helianthus anomalus]
MHDLVEEMAHYIVRGAHPNNPEKHSRIWKWKDLKCLCDMGADAVPMETEVLTFRCSYEDPGLSDVVGVSDVVANMKKLRWIRFYKYPSSSFPSNFQPRELGYLELIWSKQKELWHGYKSLPNLKILNLSWSKNLIKTPDFEGLPCLERLILCGCDSLEEIHPSIGYHKRLVFVNLSWCSRLKRFPPIIHMKKLETLTLLACRELQQFPDIQSNMDSLVTLNLSSTGIEIIPPSDGRLPGLKFLDLTCCKSLVELPDLPSSIAILRAGDCRSLEVVRDLSDYKWLWKVSLQGCYKLIGGERVLHSMLEGNAAKDRFMSVLLPAVELSSRIFTRVVTLQLPSNWYSDFSGLLVFVRYNRDAHWMRFGVCIIIRQETSTYDYSKESNEDQEWRYERVGYVPFNSLWHIPWFNPTYTKHISFLTFYGGGLNVELVRSKNKIVDLNENPIDYSECWDEEKEDRKTFEIIYHSQSSDIQIVWKHY